MFSFDNDPTFNAIVHIPRPGKPSVPVRMEFAYFDEDGYKAMIDEIGGQPAAVLLERLVVGWETQDDAKAGFEGMPEPFSATALAKLQKRFRGAGRAIMDAYWRETMGAATGN